MVTQAQRRTILAEQARARQKARQHNKLTQAKAAQQLLDELPTSVDTRGSGNPDLDQPLAAPPPWLARSTGTPHELYLCGGVVFCALCGAVATTQTAPQLGRPCAGHTPQGSLSRLRRIQRGQCPLRLTCWPDGAPPHQTRPVRRVFWGAEDVDEPTLYAERAEEEGRRPRRAPAASADQGRLEAEQATERRAEGGQRPRRTPAASAERRAAERRPRGREGSD